MSRHAPLWNIAVSFYVRADRFILSFLSGSNQVSEAFFPQSHQDQPGDWRSLVGLVIVNVKTDMIGLVVINGEKNIANESAACGAIGHFGQEVSEIELGRNMSDQRFAHGNRFTDCVVAN